MENDAGDYGVIRGEIDGKAKYCRIPIRSKTADIMQESGIAELNAGKILDMPRDIAVRTIDAIMADWRYWLNRANELFVLYQGVAENADTGKGD